MENFSKYAHSDGALPSITIYCRNSRVYREVRTGACLAEIYVAAGSPLAERLPLCARVNNRVESLSYRCMEPKDIEFVDYADRSGYRAYLRSLCFILAKAVNDLFPNRPFNLEHPVSKGYYCAFADRREIPLEAVEAIRERMEAIVASDMPFHLHTVRTVEAVALFRRRGMEDRALLLETSGMLYASYCELDGYVDYFYGCLTPSAGYIRLFGLMPYEGGLLLRVPQTDCPDELYPVVRQEKMFAAYRRLITLQRTLELENAGDLNRAIRAGQAGEAVLVSEAVQEKKIAFIAEQIAARYGDGVRIVLISGPSSSGKTTFCRRLEIQLKTNLLHPLGISLDDYYVNRCDTPLDDGGSYDFESLYAIDLPYFKDDLRRLIAGETVNLPSYNFETGKREYREGRRIKLQQNSVLLLEGIHGLNPELTAGIPQERIYRVYVSALTTISLDGHNWIPTTDNRLLRRIVRDYRFRGYSARQTIAMWPAVRRGEDRWVFPYQENADQTFNSAMLYEFAALRRRAEPVLKEVPETDDEYAEAYRLLRFLKYFNYIPEEELPASSLLREFLGGGKFKY